MGKEKSFLKHTHERGNESHILREIVRTNQVLMAGFSRKVGLSSSCFALMRLIAVTERDIGVMDLSRMLDINAAAVVRQLKKMESEGMVERYMDPRDARRNYIKLSPEGVRIFGNIRERSHRLENNFLLFISDDEMAITTKVLQKIRAYIEGLF